MRIFNKRNFIAASMTLIAMAAVGFVYAAWTTNGSGSGYAKAGTSAPLTTDVATTTATLYPGKTGNAFVKVVNPNPYGVTVTAVTLNGTNADITSDQAGCASPNTGVSFTDQTGLTIAVSANSNTSATLTNAVSMDNSSVDACKGATFTIPVNLAAASNGS